MCSLYYLDTYKRDNILVKRYNTHFSNSDYIVSENEKKILNRLSKIMDMDQKLLELVSSIILLGLVYQIMEWEQID